MISGKISGVIFFLAKKPTFDECTGKFMKGGDSSSIFGQ